MRTILVIVQHRKGRSPGQRFRIEHFLTHLEKQGYNIIFSNIITEKDDEIFYSRGRYLKKLLIVIRSFFHRLKDLKTARKADIVFIYREAYMLGTTYFEKRLSKLSAKMVFDFDDAIWLNDTSDGNKNLAWLKKPSKTSKICKYSDLVLAGNNYLAEYAQKYNSNVVVMPTCIDTNYHKPEAKDVSDRICIGWTGTSTTIKHYKTAIPILKKIMGKFGDRVYFKIIADIDSWDGEIPVKLVRWEKETEIKELGEFDIGIMPLPDNDWSRGKCGFKGLQCMALEVPVLMSPVGVNNEIIEHGENGFLCKNDDDWFQYMSELINSETLRKTLGENGRKTIIEKYSVDAVKDKFLNSLEKIL